MNFIINHTSFYVFENKILKIIPLECFKNFHVK